MLTHPILAVHQGIRLLISESDTVTNLDLSAHPDVETNNDANRGLECPRFVQQNVTKSKRCTGSALTRYNSILKNGV